MKDTLGASAFERYTKKHYDSWVTLAHRYCAVEPVLVSGFDMTEDFAMTAYSGGDTSESNISISVPTLASASTFFHVTKGTSGSGDPLAASGSPDRNNAHPLIHPRKLRVREQSPMVTTNASSSGIIPCASGWVFFPR